MDIDADVLVIGGGMAGLVAGITAAEQGVETLVVRKGQGSTADSSGAIDVAGYMIGGEAPFLTSIEGLTAYSALCPLHPYSTLGVSDSEVHTDVQVIVDTVRESIEWIKKTLEKTPAAVKGSLSKNIMALTQIGTKKPTCLVQKTMYSSKIENEDETLLFVGIKGLASYNALAAAKSMMDSTISGERGPRKIINTMISCSPFGKEFNISPIEIARFIDTEEGLETLTDQLQKAVKQTNATLVAIPPVMGLKNSITVREYLEKETGAEIFELLSFPPSVPGFRLLRSLESALKNAGGKLLIGHEAVEYTLNDEQVNKITLQSPRRRVHVRPKSVILTTGKFIGGGITSNDHSFFESLFGLPILDSSRELVSETSPRRLTTIVPVQSEGHAIFGIGIGFDNKFRPTTVTGEVFSTNVFAAGAILCGYNYPVEKSGLGVALTTGRVVGKLASSKLKEVSV